MSSAPIKRGILRSSSFTPNSDDNNSEDSCSSSTPQVRAKRLPPQSAKPPRRNVGKVERRPAPTRRTPTRGDGLGKSISFSDKVKVKEVPTIERSRSGDFFYDDEEIAEFRYEAHMEACGLDPSDFE